jgi:heme-degrading monooxygenase HmoA
LTLTSSLFAVIVKEKLTRRGTGRKEESGMYARLTTLEGPPDRIDDAIRYTQEQVLPQLQQMDGFKGFIALGDRQSGKVRGVALWESEEALRATDEAASRLRGGVADATGGRVADVEQYEVAVFEVSS